MQSEREADKNERSFEGTRFPTIWHTVDAIWHTAMPTGRRTRHPINLMFWGTPPWRMQILLGRAKQVQNEAGGTYRNGKGRVSDQEDPFRSVCFIALCSASGLGASAAATNVSSFIPSPRILPTSPHSPPL